MPYACGVERWATFDCYGTLVDWRGGIRGELARLFGDERADALLERYFDAEARLQAADPARPYRAVLSGGLAAVAGEAGLELPAGEEDALAASLPAWPVFADVRPALAEARARGWRLAILSNTDRDLLDASVAAIGVPFDVTIVAGEIGSYKPGLRHWQVFRERTGVPAGRHVHVAQSLFHDIAPARELGLASVWVNRLGEAPGPEPTRELADLRGLADALDSLVPA